MTSPADDYRAHVRRVLIPKPTGRAVRLVRQLVQCTARVKVYHGPAEEFVQMRAAQSRNAVIRYGEELGVEVWRLMKRTEAAVGTAREAIVSRALLAALATAEGLPQYANVDNNSSQA